MNVNVNVIGPVSVAELRRKLAKTMIPLPQVVLAKSLKGLSAQFPDFAAVSTMTYFSRLSVSRLLELN